MFCLLWLKGRLGTGGVEGIPESEVRMEEAKDVKILGRILSKVNNNNF